MAEHYGQLILEDDHPDNYGEIVTFFHAKYPEWRVIIEGRMPFRDNMGNARGTMNPDSALTITFRGKVFRTNSTRVIKTLRDARTYSGPKGPQDLQALVNAKDGGLFELDPIEEEIYRRKLAIEAQVREEIRAKYDQEAREKRQEPSKSESMEELARQQAEVPKRPAGIDCPNCGTIGTSRFCAECGERLVKPETVETKPKRTWDCKHCGESFNSGFALGKHLECCPGIEAAVKVPEAKIGPEIIAGGDSTNVGNIRGII